MARTCNLICIVLDATRPLIHKKIIEKELEGFGIRLNKQPAEIEFKKRDKGGVTISRTVDTPNLDDDLIKVKLIPLIISRQSSGNIVSIVRILSSNVTRTKMISLTRSKATGNIFLACMLSIK